MWFFSMSFGLHTSMSQVELEALLGHSFSDRTLLLEALTHPSYHSKKKSKIIETSKNYERLEFLGDKVLGLVITEILFRRYQDFDEGRLSLMHAYLVKSSSIARIATDLGLDGYILMDRSEHMAHGENNPHNLENVCESLIGAVFMDSSYERVKELISRLWATLIVEAEDIDRIKDAKSKLQEWAQKQGFQMPNYKMIQIMGSQHNPEFVIQVTVDRWVATGKGRTRKAGEQEAAKTLMRLVIVMPVDIRTV